LNFEYTRSNILRGCLIYSLGDTTAALLQNQFSVWRMLGIMLVGATVYAFEIPNYFKWLNTRLVNYGSFIDYLKRTLLSMAYFSPLWIARHLFFIKLFSGNFHEISWSLFRIAAVSFMFNLPVSLTANYLIQNKVPFNHRFMASAFFSAVMAVYFALAATWFK
jgi:hypothetical protein